MNQPLKMFDIYIYYFIHIICLHFIHMYAHIIIYDSYHYLSKYILTADNKYNASFMGFAMSIIVGAFLVPSGSFPQKHRK